MPARAVEPDFSDLVADLDYPLVLVTTVAGDERAGCLAGFATQTSIDPPRFLVCLSEKNRTYRVAQKAEALAVHLLPADRDDLAELFGGETGDEVDKFERCEWSAGPGGLPIVSGCPSWFAGEIIERWTGGDADHEGLVLAPFEAHHGPGSNPYRVSRGARIDPGHEA